MILYIYIYMHICVALTADARDQDVLDEAHERVAAEGVQDLGFYNV